MQPYKAGIVGATGLVGQRLIQRLEAHPWFEIVTLAASDRSAGRPFAESARWRLPVPIPERIGSMSVQASRPETLSECDVIFSALDAGVARELEPQLAAAGRAVVSNSSAFRQDDDVPLVVPEINASHLALLDRQRRRHGGGFVVTNPNCSITGLALALAPLHREYGLRRLVVVTLQAISGAGADGPRALDLTDNVIPHIPGEEEKMESELSKILGTVQDGTIDRARVVLSAHCHRVPVIDGHLEAVSIELERSAEIDEVAALLRGFTGDVAELHLPSSCGAPIVVRDEPDRPQPRLDRDAGGGMAVTVGRIRPCPVLGLKLELLSHNTVRGAAGCTVLNAELLAARNLLPRRTDS